MKFCAKKAGEQSSELFMALWIKNHGPVEEEAVVTDVKDHSFDALVCSTGINIRVYTDVRTCNLFLKSLFVLYHLLYHFILYCCRSYPDQLNLITVLYHNSKLFGP